MRKLSWIIQVGPTESQMFQKARESSQGQGQGNVTREKLSSSLLAVKQMEEGATSQGMQAAWRGGKGKGTIPHRSYGRERSH